MKPIPMKSFAAPLAGAMIVALAACVPQTRPAPPAETPPPVRPATAPPQAPVVKDWMDAAQTPGNWRYAAGVASFNEVNGQPRFAMRCDAATRTVVLSRAGQAPGAPGMTIRTESQTRTLAATIKTAPASALESRLAASDRLLDAMALSKGRFAVEVAGTPTLYLPSWAEVTRVIEDCR